jgi:hypothetical protein
VVEVVEVVDVEMMEGVGDDLGHLPKMPLDPDDEATEGAIECVMDMIESTGESGRDKPS